MLASGMLGLPEPRKLTLPLIRQSSVQALERCPRYALFQRMGLRTYGRAAALDAGSYAHTMVRILATGGNRAAAIHECEQLHNLVMEDLARHPAYEGRVDRINPDVVEKRRKDFLLGVSSGIIAWEPLKLAIASERLKIIHSEYSHEVRIPLPSISTGKRPRKVRVKVNADIVFRKPDNSVWLWDLKTAQPNETLAEMFANIFRRSQVWIYYRGYNELNPQDPASGFMYQGVCKPSIIQKKNQSLEDYIDEVVEWHKGTGRHEDKALKRADNPSTLIQPVYMTGPSFAEIPKPIATRIWNTHRFHRQSTEWSDHPPYEQSCRAMGSTCKYHDFCDDESGRTWKTTLARSFTVDADPLDSDPTRIHDNK